MDCIICEWLKEQEVKLDWEWKQFVNSREIRTHARYEAERKQILTRILRHDRLLRNHERMYHPNRIVIRG